MLSAILLASLTSLRAIVVLLLVTFDHFRAAFNHLISVVGHHGLVRDVGNGEYVRRIYRALGPDVHL